MAKIDTKVPKAIIEMPRDKPIVYFAMGSSGKSKLVAEILEGFRISATSLDFPELPMAK